MQYRNRYLIPFNKSSLYTGIWYFWIDYHEYAELMEDFRILFINMFSPLHVKLEGDDSEYEYDIVRGPDAY